MEELERRIVGWAARRRDIRTVLVIGSRARLEAPADEWSDLDVVFTTSAPARYLAGVDWLNEIGDVWAAYADPYDGVTRHVLFAGALDAGITPVSHRRLRALLAVRKLRTRSPMLLRLFPRVVRDAIDRRVEPANVREEPAGATGAIFGHTRGRVRVILDKDGLGTRVLATLPHDSDAAKPPTAEQFRAVVEEFLFLSVWNAKHLRRGELWWAKTVACDGRMKTLLLRMIEWHAGALDGPGCYTSQRGRRFESWVEPRVLDRLRATFGHYDEDDVWRASLETASLFRTIATETAERLGWRYPDDIDAHVSHWVRRCEADRREMSP
jgi:aminoglycoside 6-adenylyltransferase